MATRKAQETEEIIVKEEPVEKKTSKKVFEQTDGILCHSVIVGGLYMNGARTGITYDFDGYGCEREIEYRDLVAAVRSHSQFLFEPYIVVDDEDFVNEFSQLKKFYDEKYTTKDLKKILDLDINTMVEQIKELPAGAFNSLQTIAATAIAEGKLDSVRKIKVLDDLFDTDLNLISSLFPSV